jgi:hypothetical protein
MVLKGQQHIVVLALAKDLAAFHGESDHSYPFIADADELADRILRQGKVFPHGLTDHGNTSAGEIVGV